MPTEKEVDDFVMEAVREVVQPREAIDFFAVGRYLNRTHKVNLSQRQFNEALRRLYERGFVAGNDDHDPLATPRFTRLPDAEDSVPEDEDAGDEDEDAEEEDETATPAPAADDAELDRQMRAIFAEMQSEFESGAAKVEVSLKRACAAWWVISRHPEFHRFQSRCSSFVRFFFRYHEGMSIRDALAMRRIRDEDFVALVERYLPALAVYRKDIGREQTERELRANPPAWKDIAPADLAVLRDRFKIPVEDEEAAIRALAALVADHGMSVGKALSAAGVNKPYLVPRLMGILWRHGVVVKGFQLLSRKTPVYLTAFVKESAPPPPADAVVAPAAPGAPAPAESAARLSVADGQESVANGGGQPVVVDDLVPAGSPPMRQIEIAGVRRDVAQVLSALEGHEVMGDIAGTLKRQILERPAGLAYLVDNGQESSDPAVRAASRFLRELLKG